METFRLISFCTLLISIIGCSPKMTHLVPNTHTLFENLSTSVVSADNVWSQQEDGLIKGSGGQSYLSTREIYENFVLEAEFYPDEEINSGIFIRCKDHVGSAVDCYEVNIWDEHVNQDFRTGAIVTHGKPLVHLNSVGKWNKYEIRAENNRIQVWLNGQKTADLIDDKSNKGYVVLQVFDKGSIKFRNIRLQPL